VTGPSFCTTPSQGVFITAIGCELGIGGPDLISTTPRTPRLRPVVNPPFLLITRTKSGFYAEIGADMQESCFWRKVSVFLGPRIWAGKFDERETSISCESQ